MMQYSDLTSLVWSSLDPLLFLAYLMTQVNLPLVVILCCAREVLLRMIICWYYGKSLLYVVD